MLDEHDRRVLIKLIDELQERRNRDEIALLEMRAWRFAALLFAAIAAALIASRYL